MMKLRYVLAALLLAFSTSATAAIRDGEISWIAPIATVDGDPITTADLAGFTLYEVPGPLDTSSSTLVEFFQGGDRTSAQVVIDRPYGTYCFALTATDVDSGESGFSNVVCSVWSRGLPNAPLAFIFTI